jgi:hypothetical protein
MRRSCFFKQLCACGWMVMTSGPGYVPRSFYELAGPQRDEVGQFLHKLGEHKASPRLGAVK